MRSSYDVLERKLKEKSEDRSDTKVKFYQGDKVACYWYRSTPYGAAKLNSVPKASVVLKFNADDTYTVELEKDGMIIDDVPLHYLKNWSEATEDLRPGAGQNKTVDKWAALIKMADSYVKQGKLRHDIPRLETLNKWKDINPNEKLQKIIGERLVDDFKDAFKREDKYGDGELDVESVRIAMKEIGGQATAEEIRMCTKRIDPNGRAQSSFRFIDFVLLYANMFHPEELSRAKEAEFMGRSLRLSGEWKDLGGFARNFGNKMMKSLERAFDHFATKDEDSGVGKIKAGDLLEAFHKIGYSITVTRLQEWMIDADVRPQDTLTLADFASTFAFFFNPSLKQSKVMIEPSEQQARMTLSEVAIQCLQEERWRGNMEQTINFVRMLSAGRSEALMDTITRIRDSFEALDADKCGEVSKTDLDDLFRAAKIPATAIELPLTKFKERLERQSRGRFSLPEIFEHFGPSVQEFADASVSVAEAFAMLRLYHSTTDVRLAADMAIKIVDNILSKADDSKFWQVNVKSDEFNVKVWKLEAGKTLMKALGFGEPFELSAQGKTRTLITLKALGTDVSRIPKLPASVVNSLAGRRFEIEQEIVALEGAPSVSAAIREMRSKHSVTDVRNGLETALTLVRNILTSPKDIRLYRVKRGNPAFNKNLGRLYASDLLLRAIGFSTTRNDDKLDNDPDSKGKSAFYILKAVPSKGKENNVQFNANTNSTSQFKFPSLDKETEKFLWRRKADLEIALRALDKEDTLSADFFASSAAKDAAHVLGTTVSSLAEQSAKIRKAMSDTKSTSSKGKEKKVTAKKGKNKDGDQDADMDNTLGVGSLKPFLVGATTAQLAQITMIKQVFDKMDADKDGLLSAADVLSLIHISEPTRPY